MLATGHCTTMPGFGRGAGAKFYLWRRIVPGGEVAKGTRDTTSFIAERSGRFELAILHGEWSSRDGDLATPPELYGLADGELQVVVIVWARPASTRRRTGFVSSATLVGDDDVLVGAELERFAHPVKRPDGWSYLWLLGESDTFAPVASGAATTIACCTRMDAAILRQPISLDTAPGRHALVALAHRPAAVVAPRRRAQSARLLERRRRVGLGQRHHLFLELVAAGRHRVHLSDSAVGAARDPRRRAERPAMASASGAKKSAISTVTTSTFSKRSPAASSRCG